MSHNLNNAGINLTTALTNVFTSPANTNSVCKLFLSNVDGVNDVKFSIIIRTPSQDYTIANQVVIYGGETQIVDVPVHLNPGESIVAFASANNAATLFVSTMEYVGVSTITNAKLSNVGTTWTQLYQCPANYNATVRVFIANTYAGDIQYSVNLVDASLGQTFPIAKTLDLPENMTEIFDAGVNMEPGDIIQVCSNLIGSMNVFGSVSLLAQN